MPFDYGQGATSQAQNTQQQAAAAQADLQKAMSNGPFDPEAIKAAVSRDANAIANGANQAPQYGGYAQGANDAANYYKQLGEGYANRPDVQANTTLANQDRAYGVDAAGLMRQAAYGNAPSVAEQQFNRNLSASIAAQQAAANSARGGGANLAAAQQNASMQAAQMQGAGAQQAAMLRAQEMATARGQYGQQMLGMQAQDASTAFNQANLQLQSEQLGQQGQLQANQLANQAEQAQLEADTARYTGTQQAELKQQQMKQDQSNAMLGGLMSMGGAALMAFSDIRAKDDIHSAGKDMGTKKEFEPNPILSGLGSAVSAFGAGVQGREFKPTYQFPKHFDKKKLDEALTSRSQLQPGQTSYSPMYPGQAMPKPPLDQALTDQALQNFANAPPGTPLTLPQQPMASAGPPAPMPMPAVIRQQMVAANGGQVDSSKWTMTDPSQLPLPPVPPPYDPSMTSDIRAKSGIQPAGAPMGSPQVASPARPMMPGLQQQPMRPPMMGAMPMRPPAPMGMPPGGAMPMARPGPLPALPSQQPMQSASPYAAMGGAAAQAQASQAAAMLSDMRAKYDVSPVPGMLPAPAMDPMAQTPSTMMPGFSVHSDARAKEAAMKDGYQRALADIRELGPTGMIAHGLRGERMEDVLPMQLARHGQDIQGTARGMGGQTRGYEVSRVANAHQMVPAKPDQLYQPGQYVALPRPPPPAPQLPPPPPRLAMAPTITSDAHAKEAAFRAGQASVTPPLRQSDMDLTEPRVSPEERLEREVQMDRGYRGFRETEQQLGMKPSPYASFHVNEAHRTTPTPDEPTEADHFLAHLQPYSYRYKNPAMEPSSQPNGGRYLGVMAQDVERAPGVGPQIVKDTPQGKVLEGPALMSALAAGVGRLHQRVAQLEAGRSRSVSEGTK